MSLEVGDKAPNFNLPTDGGGNISLKDLKGETVILYFYPKDERRAAPRKPAGSAMPFRISRRPKPRSSASRRTR